MISGIQFSDVIFLALVTIWTQSYTMFGGGIAWLCYRKNSKGFGAFLMAGTVPGAVCLSQIWSVLYGNGPKDAQDGLVILFFPIFMWVLFAVLLTVGLGAAIFNKADEEKPAFDIRPYLLFIPLGLVIATVAVFFSVTYKNTVSRVARTGDQDSVRYIFENYRGSDEFGTYLDVSQNPKTPADIIEFISTDEHPAIRVRVAGHPNASDAVIENLTHDNNPCVATTAKNTLNGRLGIAAKVATACR